MNRVTNDYKEFLNKKLTEAIGKKGSDSSIVKMDEFIVPNKFADKWLKNNVLLKDKYTLKEVAAILRSASGDYKEYIYAAKNALLTHAGLFPPVPPRSIQSYYDDNGVLYKTVNGTITSRFTHGTDEYTKGRTVSVKEYQEDKLISDYIDCYDKYDRHWKRVSRSGGESWVKEYLLDSKNRSHVFKPTTIGDNSSYTRIYDDDGNLIHSKRVHKGKTVFEQWSTYDEKGNHISYLDRDGYQWIRKYGYVGSMFVQTLNGEFEVMIELNNKAQ